MKHTRPLVILFLLPFLHFPLKSQDTIRSSSPQGSRYLDHVNTYEAAVDDDGGKQFACVWSERTPKHGGIVGVLLKAFQTSDLRRFRISEDDPAAMNSTPSVCWIDTGRFAVVWQWRFAGMTRITGRIFDSHGNHLTPVLPISDTTVRQNMASPVLQHFANGNLLVAWLDYRELRPVVFTQLLSGDGRKIGENTRIAGDDGRTLYGVPIAATNNRERIALMIVDNRLTGKQAYFLHTITMKAPGAPLLLDSAEQKDLAMTGSLTWTGDGTLRCAWKDYRRGSSDIYVNTCKVPRRSFTDAKLVNDDKEFRWQRLPSIDADARGRSVIAWEDYRDTPANQRGDIYAQVYTARGSKLGRNFRINDSREKVLKKSPKVAMNSAGDYLVVWQQGVGDRTRFFGRWFRFPAEKTGNEFEVTQTGDMDR